MKLQWTALRRETPNDSTNAPNLNWNDDQPWLNYNHVDNANPNWGSVVAVVSQEDLKYLSQPPAILPISCICSCRDRYDFWLKLLLSKPSLKRIFKRSILLLILIKISIFCSLGRRGTWEINSKISRVNSSSFWPKV